MALPVEKINASFEGEFTFQRKKYSVPFTLPGDLVQFRMIRKGRRMSMEVLHIEKNPEITENIESAEPFCEAYGSCGGCRGQHFSYDYQFRLKSTPVLEKMKERFDIEIFGLPARKKSAHRHRMDFVVNGTVLGFRPAGDFSNYIDVELCPAQYEFSNQILKTLRDVLKKHPVGYSREEKTGILKYATIRTGKTGILILSYEKTNYDFNIAAVQEFENDLTNSLSLDFKTNCSIVRCFSDSGAELSVTSDGEIVTGSNQFEIELCGRIFSVPYDSFFQPNPEGFSELLDRTAEMLEKHLPAEKLHLIDLYSGAGVLSSILTEKFQGKFLSVYGCDSVSSSALLAKNNFNHFQGEAVFETWDLNQPRYSNSHILDKKNSLIVADPPRAGFSPALKKEILKSAEAEYILYISCNPSSQIRDMEDLKEKYTPVEGILADCFPQTPHLEQAVLLKKNS